jgi:3-keto-L-gulonate-6-phosphate decarboxylase
MIDIVDELKELVSQLDDSGIDYALCGGLALAVYDRARATADIDLLILGESLTGVMSLNRAVTQFAD